ncbi:hypothetical protein N7450_010948 [Penicillium hetheringtonii]|uniref:Uncharacterized protein n=1 Tax=Penicillium hetheringtonii TaxID=911720 RepID=A0AAD6GMG7_9EURO|nr:hypothetical protein N7450_010948 [Penicillium hetheringtonii]
MEVSKLPATLTLSTLLESGGDRTALNAYLQTFPHAEQLETLTNILSQYTGMDERVAAVISSIWDYICDNQIWVSKYQSLVDYQAEIHFNDLIKPIVKRHRGIERNKSTSQENHLTILETTSSSGVASQHPSALLEQTSSGSSSRFE